MMLQKCISSSSNANSRAKMWLLAFFVLLQSPSLFAQPSPQLPAPQGGQVPVVVNQVPAVIPPPHEKIKGGTFTPGPTDVLGPGERLSFRNHPYFPRLFVEVVVRQWETPPPSLGAAARAIFEGAQVGKPAPLGPVVSTYSVPVDPQRLPPWWETPPPHHMKPEPQARITQLMAADLSRNYIAVPDLDGKQHLIRFEEGTRAELMQRLRVDTTFVDTIKTFPRVAGSFAVASIIVDMMACFGGNAFNDMAFEANPVSPVCVEQLVRKLTSIDGYLGFFAFHVLNSYTHQSLSNLLAATSLYVNKPVTPEVMTALRGPIRYAALGLSFSAIELVAHVMRNPAMGECIKDVTSGDMSSVFCHAVVSDLASADHFWHDFSASFATIMTSAFATGATMSALKDAWTLSRDQQLQRGVWQLTRGARFSGALKEIRRVRVLKDIVSIGSGPPGWVVIVVTSVGEFAIFLSWQHLLETPMTTTVWSWIDRPDVRRQSDLLLSTVNAIKTGGGFSPDTINTKCSTSYQHISGTSRGRKAVENCSSTDNLASSLSNLRKHSQRYRQKVTLHNLNKSFPQHILKWDSFITNYFTGKFVLQEIYRQRAENQNVKLHIIQLATVVYSAWEEYFRILSSSGLGTDYLDPESQQIREALPRLQQAYIGVDTTYRAYIKNNHVDYIPAENTLIAQLANIKRLSKQVVFAEFDPTISCDVFTMNYYYLCRALQVMRMVPDKAQDFNTSEINSNLALNLVLPFAKSTGYDSLPLKDTYTQYLCAPRSHFEISNASNGFIRSLFGQEGLPQTLLLPQLLAGYENDLLLKQSCEMNQSLDTLDQHKFFPDIFDISPSAERLEDDSDANDLTQYGIKPGALWLTEHDTYLDPMSLLTDGSVPLISGNTPEEAKVWWDQKALPQILTYYSNFIMQFKDMLDENFLNLFKPEESTTQLLTTNVIGGLDNELLAVDNVLDDKILNSNRLDLSLIGHMQTLIRALQLASPSLNTADQDAIFQRASQIFLTNFADHIRHFQYTGDPKNFREEWTKKIERFLQEPQQHPDPACFAYDVAKKLFGDSVTSKNVRHQELLKEVEDLRLAFLGNAASSLVYSQIDVLKTEDVKKLTPGDYKNYIAMQILQEAYELIAETGIYYDTYVHNIGLYNLSPMVVDCGDGT